MNAQSVRDALAALASPEKAVVMARFFKTGPGEYAEGDVFRGITVPAQRKVARTFALLPRVEVVDLLCSPIHEERLTALFILGHQFLKGDAKVQKAIVELYLGHTRYINNWDLVDSSAREILGAWLLTKDRAILYKLAKSKVLWERRISIVATYAFIRAGEFEDTVQISKLLLSDKHDLIHKATGWMLREMGARGGRETLIRFLDENAAIMPRTAVRYAVEHFPKNQRRW